MAAVTVTEFDPFAGRTVTVRPVRPDDLVAVGAMLTRLSPGARRLRFFSPLPRPSLSVVRPLVEADHIHHETLVALWGDVVIGIAEYIRRRPDSRDAEVAVVVEDAYQRHGVARFLFQALARSARQRGVEEFTAAVLPENRAAVALARALSPEAEVAWDDGDVRLHIPLRRPVGSRPVGVGRPVAVTA